MLKKQKIISHFVGLNGIGGVQSNFVEYINNIELSTSEYQHKVYTTGDVDSNYRLTYEVFNIRKISNLYALMVDIVSRDVIVHFYNNLSSFKVKCGSLYSMSSFLYFLKMFFIFSASSFFILICISLYG